MTDIKKSLFPMVARDVYDLLLKKKSEHKYVNQLGENDSYDTFVEDWNVGAGSASVLL